MHGAQELPAVTPQEHAAALRVPDEVFVGARPARVGVLPYKLVHSDAQVVGDAPGLGALEQHLKAPAALAAAKTGCFRGLSGGSIHAAIVSRRNTTQKSDIKSQRPNQNLNILVLDRVISINFAI